MSKIFIIVICKTRVWIICLKILTTISYYVWRYTAYRASQKKRKWLHSPFIAKFYYYGIFKSMFLFLLHYYLPATYLIKVFFFSFRNLAYKKWFCYKIDKLSYFKLCYYAWIKSLIKGSAIIKDWNIEMVHSQVSLKA